jgi:hypothetical protein
MTLFTDPATREPQEHSQMAQPSKPSQAPEIKIASRPTAAGPIFIDESVNTYHGCQP